MHCHCGTNNRAPRDKVSKLLILAIAEFDFCDGLVYLANAEFDFKSEIILAIAEFNFSHG